jgi:hypothetical protein
MAEGEINPVEREVSADEFQVKRFTCLTLAEIGRVCSKVVRLHGK